MEYLAHSSVIDSSRLEGVRPIPENAAHELIPDVINVLQYLHTLRIAHGDVRPENLLRAVNGDVKFNPLGCITQDFTEIKNVPALVKARLGDASPAFHAPELSWLADNPPQAHLKSYAMDMWAVEAATATSLETSWLIVSHAEVDSAVQVCCPTADENDCAAAPTLPRSILLAGRAVAARPPAFFIASLRLPRSNCEAA